MTTRPVQISFRNMSVSSAIEETIRSRVSWLELFYPALIGCRVVVEVPHRHRRRGRPLHVRIELSLPGEKVIVNHDRASDTTARSASGKRNQLYGRHEDVHVTIHEAFDIARRRLEDGARQQRGDVKTHAAVT